MIQKYFHITFHPPAVNRSPASPARSITWKFFSIIAHIHISCFENFGVRAHGRSHPGERQSLKPGRTLEGTAGGSSDRGEAIRRLTSGQACIASGT
jgi:hypothetical protein